MLSKTFLSSGLILGFIATYIGQTLMNELIRRRGRTSYIAFCIAGAVFISAVAMTIQWAISLLSVVDHQGQGSASSSGFCGSDS